MTPEQINPNTQLCTIMGHNAQTGDRRRIFNRWLKQNGLNATAIALNVTDDHFGFTMANIATSKVDKMILEHEFGVKVPAMCGATYGVDGEYPCVDFIEIDGGEIIGYGLDGAVDELFGGSPFIDERAKLAAKMMLIAHRWYAVAIDIDAIPHLIEN